MTVLRRWATTIALAVLLSAACAAARSKTTCALPIDQCTRPSRLHAGNWPPTWVNLRAGNAARSGSPTEMVGTGPPIGGTVTT